MVDVDVKTSRKAEEENPAITVDDDGDEVGHAERVTLASGLSGLSDANSDRRAEQAIPRSLRIWLGS
jgi:hypothetical protein